MVLSSLPPPKQLSSLDANSATDTFCSTLMSCLDTFFPLSSRPARTTPSAPWLSDVLRLGYGANHKILLTLIYIDHSSLTSLIMSPLLKGHTITKKLTIHLTLACSLKHFPPSFVLLLPLLHQL